jgi:hypothetical protein
LYHLKIWEPHPSTYPSLDLREMSNVLSTISNMWLVPEKLTRFRNCDNKSMNIKIYTGYSIGNKNTTSRWREESAPFSKEAKIARGLYSQVVSILARKIFYRQCTL